MVVTRRSVAFAVVWLLLGLGLGRILPQVWFGAAGSSAPDRLWREGAADAMPPRPQLQPNMADLVESVKSGVVQVIAERGSDGDSVGAEAVPMGPDVQPTSTSAADGLQRATGFVVHRRGYVVTNYHAVCAARRVWVRLAGHQSVSARIIDWDPVSDIALLHMDPTGLAVTPLALGDSDRVRSGDWVLILGNPFDYALSAQPGMVSHPARHLRDEQLSTRYLQFAAPVYPGNSGGPLFDMNGLVVGVISRTSTLGQGISFALPANALKNTLDRFQLDGHADRGWVGLCFRSASVELVRARIPGSTEAVEVSGTVPDSPASKSSLRSGDLVVRFNGQDVHDAQELHDRIIGSVPGSQIALGVLRPGADDESEVRLTVKSARSLLDKLN